MKKKKSPLRRLVSFIMLIISIYVLIEVYGVYKQRDFNDFVRAERNMHTSTFSRDFETTLGKEGSYKIESPILNDAMFFATVEVVPNTAYKVSCKVKTEDVVTQNKNTNAGAHISIDGTIERSNSVVGTQDWTEITMYFNSKNRTSVNIGFRLGGYDDRCTGTAWFDNLKLERGITDTSNEWNFVCFVFKNIDVDLEINGETKNYNIQMSDTGRQQIRDNMLRFQRSFEEMTRGRCQVNYEIIEIEEPITSLSYDDQNEYYVKPNNITNVLEKYLAKKEYDHIFAAVKLGDLTENVEIPVKDWIGLGGMEYRNIGFSDIRIPNKSNSAIYKYINEINEFPEEVFIHEFLHTLERNAADYGYERPELHDYEKFGYKNESLVGLKQWYADYVNHEIKDALGKTYGLDSEIFTKKPVHESEFIYSTEIEIENEPKNLIEEIRSVFKNVFKTYQKVKLQYMNEE